MTGLRAFQTAFGARLRGGRHVPSPPGVAARRMAVYETLLFNNLRGFVDRCCPVARACLGEVRWRRLCRAFFRDWPCRSAWFRDIPREFVDYLGAACRAPLPRWFVDLARYEWAELAVPESLTVFDFPAAHRIRLRTTNGLERINRELRRRTRVASIFPNTDSCLRLVSALLAELDDDWMTGKVYLNFNP